jgi:hypothetical protein
MPSSLSESTAQAVAGEIFASALQHINSRKVVLKIFFRLDLSHTPSV